MSTSNPVPRIYRAVIDDVIKNVKEAFLNEGVDDQVLQELKQLWESKLLQSRAIEFMPTDVNVRVSLTYPHNMSQMQAANLDQQQPGSSHQQQSGSSHQQSNRQQQRTQPSTTQQSSSSLVQNQAGQLVYVSSHPTLGNVGPMSGAAAQAAMALQNSPHSTSAIIPQQIVSLPQVIHVQQNAPSARQAHIFPGYQTTHAPASGARVIFTPTQQQQQQQQRHHTQATKQQVVQVDGSSDDIDNVQYLQSKSNETNLSAIINSKPLHSKHCKTKVCVPTSKQRGDNVILQLDGGNDSSSDEFDDEDDEDFDNYPIAAAVGGASGSTEAEEELAEEEEPLNSEDDVSDEDPTDLFDTDNVVVCQYDKIARVRNRWKFHLKDGIMNLRSKDFVFHKANGDSEW